MEWRERKEEKKSKIFLHNKGKGKITPRNKNPLGTT